MRRWLLAIFCFLILPAVAQELEVTIFEGGEGLGFYQAATREFEAQNPGVKVVLQGDPAIADKMRMRVLEGDLPEVTNAGVDIWGLQRKGYLQEVDQWLDADGGQWRNSFLPGSLEQYQLDDKTYGVPLVYVVWSVYYNKTLFRERGWELPTTWDEFFHLCTEMKAAGVTPVAFQGRYPFYARPLVEHTYFHIAGRDAHQSLVRGEILAYENPALAQSLTILAKLSEFFQSGFEGSSHTEAQLEFFQGRAAMLFCGSWLYSEMQDNIPEEFELGAFALPLPTKDGDRGAQYASSGYFFVFSSAAEPQLGAEFLRHLTSPDVASRFAAERGIPVAVASANQALNPAMKDVAAQLEGVTSTFGPPKGPSLKGLDQVWNDHIQYVLSGSKTPQEAVEGMQRGVAEARKLSAQSLQVETRHLKKTLGFLAFIFLGAMVALSTRGTGQSSGPSLGVGVGAKFLLPSALIFTIFFTLPSVAALGVSLFRWDGLGEPQFVGTYHLRRLLLESDLFWTSLGHNLILMLVPAIFVVPFALLLAHLLHQEVVGAKLFRVAFFFPNLLGVAGVLLWQQLYNPQIGPVNRLLESIGLTRIRPELQDFAWLSDENLYYALIPMAIWAAAGFNMVLFLAAMQAVPESLYEAAELEGAGGKEKLLYITIPMIRETVAVATILMIIGGMKAFEAIWLLTNQAPSSNTHVVGTYMVQSLFTEQRIGQAAALALLLFAVVLVGSVLSHRVTKGAEH